MELSYPGSLSSETLATLALKALEPQQTDHIFARYEHLFPELCSRWLAHDTTSTTKIAAFARILPFAPHLSELAESQFSQALFEGLLDILPSELEEAIAPAIPESQLCEHLLGVFRLLAFDNCTFARYLQPARLQVLLSNPSRPVRYLTVRILCLYLYAADASTQEMVLRYVGKEVIEGEWEGLRIDYWFLSLWEEQRHKGIAHARSKKQREDDSVVSVAGNSLSDQCCDIDGVLLPRLSATNGPASPSTLVRTLSTVANLRKLARTLTISNAVLLTGLPGSGKTLLVRHLATQLGKLNSMVTLHLNEQSDAKLLIGMYTTGADPGSFEWTPGILTTAVREGRWILIEDLDRAPNEILSTFLPLIERGELLIPSRGERIVAPRGFKIIATMRSNKNMKGEEVTSKAIIGSRLWSTVRVESLSLNELRTIVTTRFPKLQGHVEAIISIYTKISTERLEVAHTDQLARSRAVTPRDLFKWCRRMSLSLTDGARVTAQQKDGMFLEAFDSFAGSFQEQQSRLSLMTCVAKELHIDSQRRDHLLLHREISHHLGNSSFQVGRVTLDRRKGFKITVKGEMTPFSTNGHTLRLLEKLGRAVECKEPLLLVGETGTGKTTCIQYMASQLGRKLVVFNLCQQSESGDLLGGFKPVNIRSLFIPLKDEFDELFGMTFSRRTNNGKFMDILAKRMAKGKWTAVCAQWRDALRMVNTYREKIGCDREEQPSKKRRLDCGTSAFPESRWNKFSSNLTLLESRISKGSGAFAFAFQEGNIVRAVRNGDWILLDEINLASPDTLEALADLFESDTEPSVLLTETGNAQRVVAHPDFRIFAAMNPATDVGKKDLPPGIRSRFTELYVDSPDADDKSLRSVVETYLGTNEPNSKRIVADVTSLYREIQDLVRKNLLVDGADQKPHFSLRTLTRTLTYARDMTGRCKRERALYEGFHMSFCTLLDGKSESLVAPLIEKHLLRQHGNARSELQRSLQAPIDHRHYLQLGHHWLPRGPIPEAQQPHYIITPFVQRNLNNLIRATSTNKYPILIQGPTSSGKTSMIEYLAKRTGNQFVRINNHEHTDLQEYLGTYVSSEGGLRFEEGILVKALREGHWMVLDELNLAPTDVLEALNRLLDDNRELLLPETQEVVRPHENFMLFATQNPAGLYGGRKVLSRAFRNRFLELHFDDIPVEELTEILHRRTHVPESWCKRIVAVYKELSLLRQEERIFEQKSFATLRDLFRWALREAETIQDLATNGYMLLAERVRKIEERTAVKEIIEKVMSKNGARVQINEITLYGSVDDLPQKFPRVDGVVWTQSMRRLYTLLAQALRNHEPVLLVGETGCGKTTVCQIFANACEKQLHIVNAHQNTETSDLIGSQRPVRNRAAIEEALLELLAQALTPITGQLDNTLGTMLHRYNTLSSQERAMVEPKIQKEIAHLSTKSAALFEWVDGSLVTAMKSGQFFLLDEISLADDSVLERLNSVLESERTLLLAEKGTNESLIVASHDFQFMATMNPGGDYGKKELSPALRNRFTEIWVPPLSDTEDILQIIKMKLASAAVAHASALVSFAQWFANKYTTSATSTVSIRDMLSWASFINNTITTCSLPLLVAIVHGAALVYIDTLGANPSAMLAMSAVSIEDERRTCFLKLGSLLDTDFDDSIYDASTISDDEQLMTFGAFSLAKRTCVNMDSTFGFNAPTTRKNAMRIARALQLSKPVLLEGNPGVGKTTLIVAMARSVGVPLTRINLSEQTDLVDLFGTDVPVEGEAAGKFAWQDAPFLKAMKEGTWVLLDEMNLASQSILEGLNACLDHRGEVYISELDQTFKRHANFRLFAAQNPHHQGGGRKGLPASFVNRFTVVYADVLTGIDLKLISKQTFPHANEEKMSLLITFVSELEKEVAVYRSFGTQGSPWEFNIRDTLRWMHLITTKIGLLGTGSVRDYLDTVFTLRFRSSTDRESLLALYKKTGLGRVSPRSFYHNLSCMTYQVGLGTTTRKKIDIPHSTCFQMAVDVDKLPVLESLMISVQQRWPVILVGQTGSGKSFLLNHLASTAGARLITFPMTPDIDAMDLVGGYEQVDRSRTVNRLRDQVSRVVRGLLIEVLVSSPVKSELLPHFLRLCRCSSEVTLKEVLQSLSLIGDEITEPQIRNLYTEVELAIETSSTPEGPQFKWVDGVLIDAIEQGHWLVLDNANFCSSSVLDRLNSLLEPDGYLIINEHSSDSGEARIVKPHPDFRIFMTVDPKYGELSRAMRNRAIELFILSHQKPCNDGGLAHAPHYRNDSSVYRFRHAIAALESVNNTANMIDIAMGHLSLDDMSRAGSFGEQLTIGLVRTTLSSGSGFFGDEHEDLSIGVLAPVTSPSISNESSSRNSSSKDILCLSKAWSMMTFTDSPYVSSILPKVRAYYESVQRNLNVSVLDLHAQSIHPMNNELLCRIDSDTMEQAEFIDHSLVLCGDIVAMKRQLQALPTRIWHGALKLLMKNIHIFVSSIPNHAARYIETALRIGDLNIDLSFVRSLVLVWWSITETIEHNRPDMTRINVLFSMLRHLSQSQPSQNMPHRELQAALLSELSNFDQSSKLTSGFSMERLWQSFRPATPTSSELLTSTLKLEKVAEQYDYASYRSSGELFELARTRASLSQAMDLVATQGTNPEGLLMGVTGLLNSLQTMDSDTDIQETPSFRGFFYLISQKLRIADGEQDETAIRLAVTSMLAQQPTKPNRSGHSIAVKLQRLIDYADLSDHTSPIPALTDSSYETLIVALEQKEFTNLAGMARTRREIAVLCDVLISKSSILMKDQVAVLDSYLGDISQALLAAHSDYFECNSLELLANVLEPQLKRLASVLQEADRYLKGQYDTPAARSRASAEIWVKIAFEALLLFTPNITFDPALKPMIERDFYFHRQQSLQRARQALVEFESLCTGQISTLRIRHIERQLSDLGKEPVAVPIIRPNHPESDNLQGEFNNLLVVLRRIETNGLETLATADDNLLQNLSQISHRLTRGFRHYDDLTTPVVGFLSCLKIGITLFQVSSRDQSSTETDPINHVWNMTPFITSRRRLLDAELVQTASMISLHCMLEALQVEGAIEQSFRRSSATNELIEHIFDRLYLAWKELLRKEQEKNAADTSLYTYRDKEKDVEEEETDPDLFPDYEQGGVVHDPPPLDPIESPRGSASRLASIHAALFVKNRDTQSSIRAMISNISTMIAHTRNVPTTRMNTPQNMMPLILLGLDKRSCELEQGEPDFKGYNFYHDHNVIEATKFHSLLGKIVKRFRLIKSVWPEHATLSEVIEHCREALSFKHIDPLAKMITKAEKIHSVMNEWQKITSREFSADSLYDGLTSLIVGWRRLELRTWARLFDQEQDKCVDEARSWWFIAYETIIVSTRSLDASDASVVKTFTTSLLKTLENYMRTTSIGEYAHRLSLLRQLQLHLVALSSSHTTSSTVAIALGNFIGFYSRFEKPIQECIQVLRKPLEKEINKAIQLASWKDINIDALRQSAKRSHQKLSKVVRKFRAILRQPASSIIISDISQDPPLKGLPLKQSEILKSEDKAALKIVLRSVPEWNDRAPRFKFVASTVAKMQARTTIGDSGAVACSKLEAFLDDIDTTSARLRKETPATLTKENTDNVKHLKTQKRRAFVDVLKDLRKMGFSSNVGGNILLQQESTAIILSQLGSFPDSFRDVTGGAEYYLHKVLQTMPKVRDITREHSGDVTPAEVARSKSLLESIMQMSIQQRKSISDASHVHFRFNEALHQLENLWRPDEYKVRAETIGCISFVELHRNFCWFSTMLETANSFIDIQSKLSTIDLAPVTHGISDFSGKAKTLITQCEASAKLPAPLTTTLNDSIALEIQQLFDDVKSSFAIWSSEYPATQSILDKVLPYTNLDYVNPNIVESLESSMDVSDAQSAILDTADAMLAAVEEVESGLPALSLATDNENWLVNHNKAFANITKSLRLQQVCNRIEGIIRLTYTRFTVHAAPDNSVTIIAALTSSILPVFRQYSNSCSELLTKYTDFHTITTQMLYHLSKSFIQVGTQGFCTPSEMSDEKSGQNEKLEAGTGLGEGEGAEDISKDIGDDEDLADLAQEPGDKNEKDDDIEDEKDAVDMADQEMEGEIGDVEEKATDDSETSDKGDDDIEDDVGDVDDLGPSTVDEKMWDESGNDNDKEKAGEDANGSENKDEQVAASDDKNKGEEFKDEAEDQDESEAEDGNEELEAIGQDEVEQMDPHMQETEKLDLPDDLNMDDNKSDTASDRLGEFDDFDDTEEQPDAECQNDLPEVDDDMEDGESMDGNNEDPTVTPEETEEELTNEQDKTDFEEVEDEQEGPKQHQDDVHDLPDKDNEHAAHESADLGSGQDAMDMEHDQQNPSTGAAANQNEGTSGDTTEPESQQPTEAGTEQRADITDGAGRGEDEESAESRAFKKIGDTIERWYKQQREILDPSFQCQESSDQDKEVDMTDADFEHLPDDEAKADAQALGAATEEQAKAINEDLALPSDNVQEEKKDEYAMDVDDEEEEEEDELTPQDANQRDKNDLTQDRESDGKPHTFIGESNQPRDRFDDDMQIEDENPDEDADDIEPIEYQLSTTHLDSSNTFRTAQEARVLWSHHENSTRPLSQSLTEQLRLILSPTTATKLRGDFRTGKRLNLKRIIPYIASSYKRDKIWLRRSLPSKRAYQIMLALDDSQSMAERRTTDLAFETLALVSRALNMLEAGELAVVSFGSEVRIAHPFERAWSSEAGADVLRQFGFQQKGTDVKKLVKQSIDIFRDARLRASGAGADLWQLGIVISDGYHDNHAEIQRLVRQAQEERIMIVFVIVDAVRKAQGASAASGAGDEVKDSVLDLRSPEFTDDGKVVWKRYMDTFAFRWYVVVRDVAELPGVLSMALRQWFKEVVDSS
ncbi:midasin [Pseudovirgaria hyperparasitica]|uniref:Midasin n=1 Tax=Pseudovirgaria hyperparasitica TaxID=470096 RepID=A0A6A6WMI9_9PEZI|nr:midasin [Pseudovirgaria hyperparasitica]KAF2763346.1 midasin [Pseudovirgaria hyperparasitica]